MDQIHRGAASTVRKQTSAARLNRSFFNRISHIESMFCQQLHAMNLLPEPLAPKPLFHPKPLCPESYSRNLMQSIFWTNRSPRNRLIPNHLLLNHLLCKFSLWPHITINLRTHPPPRGMAGGGGATKRRKNGSGNRSAFSALSCLSARFAT